MRLILLNLVSLEIVWEKMAKILPNFKKHVNLTLFSTSYSQGFKFLLADCPLILKVLPFHFHQNDGKLSPGFNGGGHKLIFYLSFFTIIVHTAFYQGKMLCPFGEQDEDILNLFEIEGRHQTMIFLFTLSLCFFVYVTTLLKHGQPEAVSFLLNETFALESDFVQRRGKLYLYCIFLCKLEGIF